MTNCFTPISNALLEEFMLCNHHLNTMCMARHLCHEDNAMNICCPCKISCAELTRRGRLVHLCHLMMPYCPQSVGNQHLSQMQTDRWRIIATFKPLLLGSVCTSEQVFTYYSPVCSSTYPLTPNTILCERDDTLMSDWWIVFRSISHLTLTLHVALDFIWPVNDSVFAQLPVQQYHIRGCFTVNVSIRVINTSLVAWRPERKDSECHMDTVIKIVQCNITNLPLFCSTATEWEFPRNSHQA